MKRLTYIFSVLFILAFAACSELEKETALTNPVAPVLAGHDAIVIDAENLNATTVFSWETADFGYAAAIEYSLLAQIGEGEPVQVASAYSNSLEVKLEDLNRAIIGAGAIPYVENTFVFSLSAAISTTYQKVISAPVTVKITAFKAKPVYLYIAGNLTLAGWEPGNELLTLKAILPTDDFEGMVDLRTNDDRLEFKFCTQPNWDVNYGGSKDALELNGSNIGDFASGYYWMIVDAAKTKIKSALKINTIGVIGDGVPGEWGTETKLTYYSADNTWVIAAIDMTNGKDFLFRINDDWGNKIGVKPNGQPNECAFGGDNIPVTVPTGSYKIILHANALPYTVELIPVI